MTGVFLLLGGMLNDERVWQPVAQRLHAVCDVHIAHFPTQESIADMAQAAWQLVVDLPPDRPPILPDATTQLGPAPFPSNTGTLLSPPKIPDRASHSDTR
jgi:hypothetical protein